MSYNQLHKNTVFFNFVSLNMLHVGVFSLIFSNVKFKMQTAKLIFLVPIHVNINSAKYLVGGYIQSLLHQLETSA